MRHSLALEHRRLAGLDDVLGPATAAAGFIGSTWPVTSQSNSMRTAASCCFTPALHASPAVLSPRPPRRTAGCRERRAAIFAPGEKPAAGARIGPAGVIVVDVGGKEFDIAPGGLVAGVGDECRYYIGVDRGRERGWFDDGGELVVGGVMTPSLPQFLIVIKDVITSKMTVGEGAGPDKI